MDTKKLLLAEDDIMLASLLKFRLEREGYHVTLCADGKMVKEKLESEIPDLIVSDIMMPYFSGIELTDFLRNSLNSTVPIILISAASNDENVVSAFEMGANDFISKPVSPSELLVRVKRELIRNKTA
ncbi:MULTISPECIES: response regulator transcription factor [Flavobacteriaceae]|uniref:response regulator transcription factor n=1 Tax=Flavobacteriaceae TaxID=49546 RepID=UPI0010AE71B7|nr:MULTISPECIES: response regulator transcription factor [Flavobacteriaceae]NJB35609.1 response regulator transcription factor [Croceivirga sp. JEA036]TKD66090.1 response regulator transcription factor [Flavobacterium sp. ASW18X]